MRDGGIVETQSFPFCAKFTRATMKDRCLSGRVIGFDSHNIFLLFLYLPKGGAVRMRKGYASTILTVIGGIGVIGVAISAAMDTPKALKLLEEAQNEKDGELTKSEMAKAAATAYIPTAILCASTLTCIFGANVLSRRNQAALTSAYALLDRYHKEYRRNLVGLYGKGADVKVRMAMTRNRCDCHQIGLDCPDGPATFYDEISGESITCYEREVMDAEYHLNRNFALRGYASLNEFYEFLGMPKTAYGDKLGWSSVDGLGWVDFQHSLVSRDDGGDYIYSIDMLFPPTRDYMEGWA